MSGLSKEQVRKLNKLIKKYVAAQVELSWAGSQAPIDRPLIEAEAADAKKALRAYIAVLAE